MGYISNIYELNKLMFHYNNYPIISCISIDIITTTFKEYKLISLGELLSRELIKTDKNYRCLEVEKITEVIISRKNTDKLLIKDIDILFNPDYKLDILRLFTQLSRNRNLIIHWPGVIHNDSLIYSKPEYPDYKKYLIKDYDVICLI